MSGRRVEPGVELGEEVADGLDEGPAGDYRRPALSFSNRGPGPEQGHRQLMDLVEQGLEAFVFGGLCVQLKERVFGHVDGAGLAVLLEGEVLAGMEGSAVVTAALRSATAVNVCIVQKWPRGPGEVVASWLKNGFAACGGRSWGGWGCAWGLPEEGRG